MSHSLPTVAIVEDDESLRRDVARLVEGDGRWKVAGAYPTAEAALAALARDPVDMVIMDINLPGMNGIECVGRLRDRAPQTLVIIVTVYDDSDQVFAALAAGASGYLLKRDIPLRLLDSLKEMLSGGAPMSSHIARQVVRFFHQKGRAKRETDNLTSRELQVLELLAEGSLYKEIADRLGIVQETVNTHVRSIYTKLHVHSRTEAVVKFLKGRTE